MILGVKVPSGESCLGSKKKPGAALRNFNENPLKGSKPFFNMAKDKNNNEVVKLFIDAVSDGGFEDAKLYLSKSLKAVGVINFDELKKFFNENIEYKYLNKVRFESLPESIVTNSILVMNDNIQKSSIIHLYLINEPDTYGNWKICGIEKE